MEIDETLSGVISDLLTRGIADRCNERIKKRLADHAAFVAERERTHGPDCFKHRNRHYDFPVMTKQEAELKIEYLKRAGGQHGDAIIAEYATDVCLDHMEVNSLFAGSVSSTQ